MPSSNVIELEQKQFKDVVRECPVLPIFLTILFATMIYITSFLIHEIEDEKDGQLEAEQVGAAMMLFIMRLFFACVFLCTLLWTIHLSTRPKKWARQVCYMIVLILDAMMGVMFAYLTLDIIFTLSKEYFNATMEGSKS